MSLSDEQWLFLQDVAKLIKFAVSKGMKLTGGELMRTPEQQELHYKAGRSKTMNSKHLTKLAIDLNLIVNGQLGSRNDYRPLGQYWESLSPKNRWGGNFTGFVDAPHFERNI